MKKVFISHSKADKVLAHSVAEKLRSWDIDVFLDFDRDDGLVGGTEWEAELLSSIRDSVAVVVCCTESVTNSLWCFGEMLIARYERKPVIPILLHGPPESIWATLRNGAQYIDLTTDPTEGYNRLRTALERLIPPHESRQGNTTDNHRSPYLGLLALTESDAPLYFGRERDLEAGLGRLRPTLGQKGPRLLAITGRSGSGKSSFVLAGLIPSLKLGAVVGAEDWLFVSFTPGEDPVRRLAEALKRVVPGLGSTRQISDQLRQDDESLGYVLNDARAESKKRTVCLFIDQLEELVTITPEETTLSFLQNLQSMVRSAYDDLVLITTIRIDMLGSLLSAVDTPTTMFEHPFVLGPLTPADLKRVIVGPAKALGWSIDPDLVERLVDDASESADPLPLLSFVLSLMAEHSDARGLTVRDYDDTGGLALALARHAEDAISRVPESEREQIVHLFVENLVVTSSDGKVTKRSAVRSKFPRQVNSAMEILISERLLVAGVDASGKPTVDFAHEAVLRHWPRIRDAAEFSNAELRYARRLLAGAKETWLVRKALPTEVDARLILESLDRLGPDSEELEVLLRWSLTFGASMEQFRSRLSQPGLAEGIVQSIVDNDTGMAQYGLLTSETRDILRVGKNLESASQHLLGSPVEAVRRAAARALGALDPDDSVWAEVPAGEYLTGPQDAFTPVSLNGFRISRFLVTNREYAEYVDATGNAAPQDWIRRTGQSAVDAVRHIADYPVSYVDYFGALGYCAFRSSVDRLIRLPTETEWEVAFYLDGSLRPRPRDYPWGDKFEKQRCNTGESGVGRPTPIGLYSSMGGDSGLAISDMCGNVWEWTCSAGRGLDFAEIAYPQQSEIHDVEDSRRWMPRVQRGGTFLAHAGYAKRSARLINLPDLALQDFGFRVVTER